MIDWLWLQGVALTKVPKIKFLVIIGGAMFKAPSIAEKAYASPIQCQSLHFLGILISYLMMVVNLIQSLSHVHNIWLQERQIS